MLHHNTAPATILFTANEDGPTIRMFARENPVIQDDIDNIPPRNYHEMDSWVFAPNNGTVSPIFSHSSSIGYFSGSDWTTDSSWFSYDSLIQSVFQPPISSLYRPLSSLPPIPDVPQESRGLIDCIHIIMRTPSFLRNYSMYRKAYCRDPRGVTEYKQQEKRLRRKARKSTKVGQKCQKKPKKGEPTNYLILLK